MCYMLHVTGVFYILYKYSKSSFLRDGACFSHLHFLCVCLLLSFLHVEIGREMKGWRDELENARGCLLSLFCHDWKRERALTSVGGFGPSTCLLMHPCGPCGIRESKMNKLTHFPLSSCHSFPLSILFIRSPLLQSHFFIIIIIIFLIYFSACSTPDRINGNAEINMFIYIWCVGLF